MDMTIDEFGHKYKACKCGWKEAKAHFNSLDDFFYNSDQYYDILWAVTRDGVLTEKESIQFACWCVRQIWHLLRYEQSKNAIVIAEKYIKGEATEKELHDAHYDARTFAYEPAAIAAAAAAHITVYYGDVYTAASSANHAVAYHCTNYVWGIYDAGANQSQKKQINYLRKNFKPNWKQNENE